MFDGADRSARASSAHCRTPSGSWGSAADPRRSRTRQEEALARDQVGIASCAPSGPTRPRPPGLTQPRVETGRAPAGRRDEHSLSPLRPKSGDGLGHRRRAGGDVADRDVTAHPRRQHRRGRRRRRAGPADPTTPPRQAPSIAGPPTGFAQSLFEHPCQGGVRAEGGVTRPAGVRCRDRTGHVGVHVVPDARNAGTSTAGPRTSHSTSVGDGPARRRTRCAPPRPARPPLRQRRNGFDAGAAAGAVRDEPQLRGAHRLP